jgi:hypothetical protein
MLRHHILRIQSDLLPWNIRELLRDGRRHLLRQFFLLSRSVLLYRTGRRRSILQQHWPNLLRLHVLRGLSAMLRGGYNGRFRAFLCKRLCNLLRKYLMWHKPGMCRRALPGVASLIRRSDAWQI